MDKQEGENQGNIQQNDQDNQNFQEKNEESNLIQSGHNAHEKEIIMV
jgi:hypothetical protein